MATNPTTASATSSKAASSSKAPSSSGQASPAQSQQGSASVGDSFGHRRSGGNGSFGAGAFSRSSASPRNNQGRKQHKPSKRFRVADEDAIAETAAMRSTPNNRKGQNITHLMNFTLPPLSHHNPHHHNHRLNRRGPGWGASSGYRPVDKARYVHANYRFIVDPGANYHAQGADADEYLQWNTILQILVSSQSQSASCPICLGTPVAPRMAKCGHIFCLPCLIRYMHSDDDANHQPEKKARWKKCPLCWDSIYISETRPVRWYTGEEAEPPREGADVVLRLVKRVSGSTLALPRDGADALGKDEDIPWYFAAEVMDYARIMKGSEDYMMEQFDADIAAVQMQDQEDELMFGEDNAEWTRRAVRMLHESKERVKGIGGPPSMPAKPVEPKPKRAIIEFNTSDEGPDMYAVMQAARSGQSLPGEASRKATPSQNGLGLDAATTDVRPPTISSPQARNLNATSHTPSEYYFYQALLHYYLSPLDIRILKEAFGSFASFPATILPRVEHVSTGHVVDDDLRKRAKYLGHLPYGCEVGFLECDWTDTVSAEVLEKFKPEIERRRKRNDEKDAREERARIRAEREEDEKRYSHLRRRRPDEDPTGHFHKDDFQPLVPNDSEATDADPASTSHPWGSRPRESGFASLANLSTSPSASRTIWGTPVVASSTSPNLGPVPNDADPTDDGWLQGWERDLLQEETLVAQAQSLSLAGESSKSAASSAGKKKKAKKITLMSTNVRRGA